MSLEPFEQIAAGELGAAVEAFFPAGSRLAMAGWALDGHRGHAAIGDAIAEVDFADLGDEVGVGEFVPIAEQFPEGLADEGEMIGPGLEFTDFGGQPVDR